MCIQNSGSFKVKEKELVDTEKKKKAGQMDSEPNTYKHRRFMSAGVYISAACLKIQQRAAMETEHRSLHLCLSDEEKKKKGEIVRRLSTISKHTNHLQQEWFVQTSVLASIQLWKEEGSEKKKIKLSLSLDPRRLSSSHEPPWLLSPLDDPDRLDHESIKVLF